MLPVLWFFLIWVTYLRLTGGIALHGPARAVWLTYGLMSVATASYFLAWRMRRDARADEAHVLRLLADRTVAGELSARRWRLRTIWRHMLVFEPEPDGEIRVAFDRVGRTWWAFTPAR